MVKQKIGIYLGYCVPVREMAEILSIQNVMISKCPFCGHNVQKVKFCGNCGIKFDGTLSEANDIDVFNVLIGILGNPPHNIVNFLYNGYVCVGYELINSNNGVAIFDNNPQYKPWKEMLEPITKYVNKNPISSKLHLLKASIFAVGG